MIGHFPTPYLDELLYSICARFSHRLAYPSAKSVLQELFGDPTASAVADFPSRLGYLAEALPKGTSLTVDHLINQHTLLPFFCPFLPFERVKQIRRDMQVPSGPAIHMRSGVMGSNISMPGHLRFCPVCSQEDKEKFGETYWHRLHQLPGVEVCLSHQVFLENSSIALCAGRNNLLFVSAHQVAYTALERRLSLTNRDHLSLLKIARDATWLLENPSQGVGMNGLYNRYLRLLVERGLATHTGSIHVSKLHKEFRNYHSAALLRLLHCEFTGRDQLKTNWLLRLVRPPRHAHHPLYHLLLMQFLNCTVEEFFQLPEALCPFGEGPWPCLNPAADHYRQSVIMECQSDGRLRYGKPTGKFSCECGFAYARTGPDSSPEDRFSVGRMISFGQAWEAKLKELWKDSSLSLSEVGRRLRVDPLTIRRHAARLKLSFSRSGSSSKPLNHTSQLKGNHTLTVKEKRQYTYRKKWLSVMKRNRKVTLKTLRQKCPPVYAWLRQNDLEWLQGHRPRFQRHIQSTSSVDWKRRDSMYAVMVQVAAVRLKNSPGRPVQVTKTAIGRAVGAISLLQQKLHKMPLTAQVLANVVETRVDYAIRRIWWVTEYYLQVQVIPHSWQLTLKSNVYSLRDIHEVKCAIEVALRRIESELWPERSDESVCDSL